MADAVQPRLQAYLDLLHRELVLLRNYAEAGNVELSRIEADHLHNIPTLLYEDNEQRHELGAAEYLEQAGIWYSGPWMVLAEAVGVQFSTWDQEP